MGLFDSVVSSVGGAIGGVIPLPGAVKRFGNKIAHSKALRIGDKIAGGIKSIGSKVSHIGKSISHGADVVGKFSGKAASLTSGIPLVGTAAGLLNKGVQGASLVGGGLQGVGGAMTKVGGAAQGVIRVGRSMGDMKNAGDLVSTMRDIARSSNEMGGATSNLVSQARSVGTKLQRRK